jgi:hypothetical protein
MFLIGSCKLDDFQWIDCSNVGHYPVEERFGTFVNRNQHS